jgi:hypothetical protein
MPTIFLDIISKNLILLRSPWPLLQTPFVTTGCSPHTSILLFTNTHNKRTRKKKKKKPPPPPQNFRDPHYCSPPPPQNTNIPRKPFTQKAYTERERQREAINAKIWHLLSSRKSKVIIIVVGLQERLFSEF